MASMFLPFSLNGGDGAHEVHEGENAPLAPASPSATPAVTAMTEVEELRAQLAAKDLELRVQTTEAAEQLELAIRMHTQGHDQIHTLRTAHAQVKRELEAEVEAHWATRAAHEDVVERLEDATKTIQRLKTRTETAESAQATTNLRMERMARRISQLEAELAQQKGYVKEAERHEDMSATMAREVKDSADARVALARAECHRYKEHYHRLVDNLEEERSVFPGHQWELPEEVIL